MIKLHLKVWEEKKCLVILIHNFLIKDFNTMGIFEVLFSIRKFIKMIKYLANIIKNNNYDLVITIDSPDFNYPLVKRN